MATFFAEYGSLLWEGTLESIYMSAGASFFAVVIGLPLGVLLFLTAPGRAHACQNKTISAVLGAIVNIGRSFPFLILMLALLDVTRFITGSTIGPTAAIVPLTVAAAPFIARLVENCLAEVDSGIVEASICMGATQWQIVTRVLLVEALPSLVRALSFAFITIIGYSAMGGAIGAGGLGDLAIRFGFHRRIEQVMWVSIAIIMGLVALVQGILGLTAKSIDKKNKA